MFRFALSAAAGLLLSAPLFAATINLGGDSTEWAVVMDGSQFDVAGDQQANSAELELVGGVSLPLLYTQYDDNNTPGDTSDDTVAYRVRVSGQKTMDYSAGYMFLGFDLDLDGDLDYYLSASGKSSSGGIVGWDPGTDLNTSPSTTSITNPTQIAPLDFTVGTGNVAFVPVDATTNSTIAPIFDSDLTNGTDYFLSFQLSFNAFKASAEAKSGITGITPQTAIQYTLATSTNPNSYTSDVGGYNDNVDDMAVSYADSGAFSPPTSLSNVYPEITSNGGGDSASITITSGATGTTVTSIVATDANSDPIKYSISGGADAADFSIDEATGVLTLAQDLSNGVYEVIVKAQDLTDTIANGGVPIDAGSHDTQTLSVTVTVADTTPPVITLLGTDPMTVAQGGSYTDAGASALDNEDGDISASIVTVNPVNTAVVGAYTVTYNVSDSSGNPASEVTRTVNVVDQTAPVITLLGTSPVSVAQGGSYTDAGATASDNEDGDISADIVTVNPVDPAVVGTYTVTYNVSDSSGNAAAEVIRTVVVSIAPLSDEDSDGISNSDECPSGPPYDASCRDTDSDGIPDYLDIDSDNDGITDEIETAYDSDTDGIGDYLDLDSDNDGLYDLTESGIDNLSILDSDNDGRIDNSNSVGINGLADTVETSSDSGSLNYPIADSDGDGIEDFRDLDSDNDGLFDITESNGSDDDNDGVIGAGVATTMAMVWPVTVNPWW
jgi:hypothetical protein